MTSTTPATTATSWTAALQPDLLALVDSSVATNHRREICQALSSSLALGADAYITLSSHGTCRGQLPVLDWAGLKKAYTLHLWVRPRLGRKPLEETDDDNDDNDNYAAKQPRLWYRFATSTEDVKAVGVAVIGSEWVVVEDDEPDNSTNSASQAKDTTDPTSSSSRYLQTTLTAMALPRTLHSVSSSSICQIPIFLLENSWSLVCFTHIFPYLKRPQWMVTVNGVDCGHGELAYPTPHPDHSFMQDGRILQNVLYNGAVLSKKDVVPDDAKSASQLRTRTRTRLPLFLDVATISLSPLAVPLAVQALSVQAGPQLSLQSDGRLCPLIPPVANWTKGSLCGAGGGGGGAAADTGGPKTGIPLIVHSHALTVQQGAGADATSLIWAWTALAAHDLATAQQRSDDEEHETVTVHRIVCTMPLHAGQTSQVPRVGLMQPGPRSFVDDLDTNDEGPPILYFTGKGIQLVRATDVYQQLRQKVPIAAPRYPSAFVAPPFSLSIEPSYFVLPFFLSLCPPHHLYSDGGGTSSDASTQNINASRWRLYKSSVENLVALYVPNDGVSLAATLIHALATALEAGGARMEETILQDGLLHCLAISLRRSLQRATRAKILTNGVYHGVTVPDVLRRLSRISEDCWDAPPNNNAVSSLAASVVTVPPDVAQACARLVSVCCGPAAPSMEYLLPAERIQRTSDLALTAIFGFALDADLWGIGLPHSGNNVNTNNNNNDDSHPNVAAAKMILETVADRYGGFCVTFGYILRSQISVQFLLDIVRLGWDGHHTTFKTTSPEHQQQCHSSCSSSLQDVGLAWSKLLCSMLLASLSNRRSISQAEHDVSACMNALSDCSLGSVGTHVVLNALVGVLTWCEVLPVEACAFLSPSGGGAGAAMDMPPQRCGSEEDEEHKTQVASRLGRNMIMSQFHDVVAPMILSRTVFSAENASTTNQQYQILLKQQQGISDEDKGRLPATGSLSWEVHWRLALLLFSWVASLAGPEGLVASRLSGSLLLASGLAGSLVGAMDNAEKAIVSALFLPPPSTALMIGNSMRTDEWSYTDLLSDRLSIMMPLLPGIVVCLLSYPSNSAPNYSAGSLSILAEVLTAVGGAFHRVFGGFFHYNTESLQTPRIYGSASAFLAGGGGSSSLIGGSSETLKAAKNLVPHLLVVAMLLEEHISRTTSKINAAVDHDGNCEKSKPILVLVPQVTREKSQLGSDLESWVDVDEKSQTLIDPIDNGVVVLPTSLPTEEGIANTKDVVDLLRSCETNVVNTAASLISKAMSVGGAGASLTLWNSIFLTLEDSVPYAVYNTLPLKTSPEVENAADGSEIKQRDHLLSQNQDQPSALNMLCRLISVVLVKSLKRTNQWEVWSYEVSSAISKVCLLVQEKNLLRHPLNVIEEDSDSLSKDQVLLLKALLDILTYGRDTTGWCQLALPTMTSVPDMLGSSRTTSDLSAASKLLLPVLNPCLRIVLCCVEILTPSLQIEIPYVPTLVLDKEVTDEEKVLFEEKKPRVEVLINTVFDELDLTLTAAIVGLSFAGARDIAIEAMALLRKAAEQHLQRGSTSSSLMCKALFVKIAEELRVRYEAERRLRENALFDNYEDIIKNGINDVSSSQSVESIFLGGDLIEGNHKRNEDFILYHDQVSTGVQTVAMGYEQYQGLGAALEDCKMVTKDVNSEEKKFEKILFLLSPFLESWDALVECDAKESELVDRFESVTQVKKNDSFVTSKQVLPMLGSETAADAMSTYFELAAAEKGRLKEVMFKFFPGHRFNRISFTERYCWARYFELGSICASDIWERGVPDGNRDVRSRVPTVPCSPQFRRFIPKYLDHYSEVEDERLSSDLCETAEGRSGGFALPRPSALPGEIDAFTRSLIESGNLAIVDITKQEDNYDEELELDLKSPTLSMDEDDVAFSESDNDSFPIKSMPMSEMAVGANVSVEPLSTVDDSHNSLIDFATKGHHNITTSAFSTPPDNASSSLSLIHSLGSGMIEQHLDNCLHVKAEGSRSCTLLLTSTHLILEYDGDPEGWFEGEVLAAQEEAERQRMVRESGDQKEQGPEGVFHQKHGRRQREVASLRPKSIRWNLSEVSHVYLRRYRLRDSALELFFIPSGGTSYGGYGIFSPATSLFMDFGSGREGNTRRDDAAFAIMQRSPPQALKQWPDRSAHFLHDQLSRITLGWVEGRMTNFDYLLHLNMLAGRSYNDICQYPVFPWVLSDYTSAEIPDLTSRNSYRDLTKPVGALNPHRLEDFIERFNTFADPSIPPFMYGSHYSTSAGVVLHFLVRQHPFAGLHRQLQSGHFDVADRLFSSVPRTWSMCTGTSAAEVKELTPEWYCNPSFLRNVNNFKLGTSQDGDVLGDVALPPWSKGSPEIFVEVLRAALESEICSEMLPDWIDLIFGRKQQGPESIKAHNVFFYLTYYGSVDVASIEDEDLRQATELQIAHFGQCPMQLFRRAHVRRLPRSYHRLSFYQLLSPFCNHASAAARSKGSTSVVEHSISHAEIARQTEVTEENVFLPFSSSPMSHWVHLDAPPPGPHAPLIAVRFAGTDRCLAVDAKGVFHTFRWVWRSDEHTTSNETSDADHDKGCFVAQRELPRFRSVPRLMFSQLSGQYTPVAISKTLFAGRSVLLVLSDGDGCGGLGMQLVDPSKGIIRGEAMVPFVHAGAITCIATDPIGTAAGHGGVGGELALIGSLDGSATLWRFMSSHYLPLRPRVRFRGHEGEKVSAVAICAATHIAITISSQRCCLHSIGNGTLSRTFGPPDDTLNLPASERSNIISRFADTPALGISVQGFIVTVCESVVKSTSGSDRRIVTLHLFTIEGISLGSKPLESWRGLPHKMIVIPGGTAVLVCCGRGITIHRLSALEPLEIVDEWLITESEDLGNWESIAAAYDMDLGPSINRPVVAAAACSNGVLRFHALPGISAWSERHKKGGLTQTVGSVLAKPAQRFGQAFKDGLGLGRQLAGVGRDIGREVSSDVKERGVGGFLGSFMSRKKSQQNMSQR